MMAITTSPNITLDLRGLDNPEPIVRLAEATTAWHSGDTVRVLADDRYFANDFLRWSVGCDIEVLSLKYLPTGATELKLRLPGSLQRLTA